LLLQEREKKKMEKEKEKETKNHAVVAAAKAEEDERLKWEEQQKQRIEKLKRMAEGGASATIGDGGDDDNGDDDDNENSRVRAVSEASEELMYLTRAKSSDSGTSKRSTNTNRRGSFEDAAKRGSLETETETETKILHKFDRMPGFSFVKEGELSPQNVEYILEFVDVGDCEFFAGVGNSENFYSHPINSSMAKDV